MCRSNWNWQCRSNQSATIYWHMEHTIRPGEWAPVDFESNHHKRALNRTRRVDTHTHTHTQCETIDGWHNGSCNANIFYSTSYTTATTWRTIHFQWSQYIQTEQTPNSNVVASCKFIPRLASFLIGSLLSFYSFLFFSSVENKQNSEKNNLICASQSNYIFSSRSTFP